MYSAMAYYLPASEEVNVFGRACSYIGVAIGKSNLRRDVFLRGTFAPPASEVEFSVVVDCLIK